MRFSPCCGFSYEDNYSMSSGGTERQMPEAGNWSICVGCGGWCVFELLDDGTLAERVLTDDEIDHHTNASPEWFEAMTEATAAVMASGLRRMC